MRAGKWAWLVRVLIGAAAGLLAALVFIPYFMDTRLLDPVVCLLCTGLGGAAGVATLPFADDGKSLLLRSAAHFAVTSVLFLLLMVQFYGWDWAVLLLLEGMLALLYTLIWLGRWIGWYVEVMQLRTLLGLEAGPTPLKWRETLPYVPFVLLLCDGLPLLLRWAEHEIQRGSVLELPILSALLLPFVLLHVVSGVHRRAVPLLPGGRSRPGGQCTGVDVPPGGAEKGEKRWGALLNGYFMISALRLSFGLYWFHAASSF